MKEHLHPNSVARYTGETQCTAMALSSNCISSVALKPPDPCNPGGWVAGIRRLTVDSARLAREHNNANVISLGQRMMSLQTALDIMRVWLETPFAAGRHERRINQIDA